MPPRYRCRHRPFTFCLYPEGPLTRWSHYGINTGPLWETFRRIDRFLRLGNATPAMGQKAEALDEFFRYVTPVMGENIKQEHKHAKGVLRQVDQNKIIYLKQVLMGEKGRTSPDQITYSERGNIQGAQFYTVAAKVYEKAKQNGLGREIPTDWFLQDIRD